MSASVVARAPEPFAGGGAVGAELAKVNWAATPLGDPATWPQSLVSAVRVVLTSRFSMWMAWGPELTFFCNDKYRRDTLGTKYPWALGRPASEVWSEIWPDIAPRIERVMQTGEATWDESLLLFLERSGYSEETYHTFSYSPLTDDEGAIVGMLCVVSEDTAGVVGTRRMGVLRDLGAALSRVNGEADVLRVTSAELSQAQHSLPFCLLYSYDQAGDPQLVGSAGVPVGHPLLSAGTDWEALARPNERGVDVVDLRTGFSDLPTGAWDIPPGEAVVVPFRGQADAAPFGFLVGALNPHRRIDPEYEGFVALVAGQVAAALVSAKTYDAERERAERLAELDRAKTAFFTNVSHELRTPLTLLLGPAEDALGDTEHPLPAVQRERLRVIARNAQRLLKLVNTLLDFSRLESGRARAHREPTDLTALTVELAEAFSDAARRAGLSLTVDCADLAEPVWVDQEMWSKIVLNLLSNAVKFTLRGGITVRLRRDGDDALLEVSDTGQGIPASELERLFERFHRVPGATSRTHEGSGIGLALVAELAQLHGGTATARSTLGEGSTFEVRLPLERPVDAASDAAPSASAVVPAARRAAGFLAEAERWTEDGGSRGPVESAGDRPRVLVVDDNADMRDYVAGVLSERYDVVTAVDGLDGLRQAQDAAPDLVITDVMMPGIDGFELLARLRRDGQTSHLPVIMLSARAGEESTVEGLDAGADDYLVKPFAALELLARVRSNLELDRVRRSRELLERSRELLDQAQRIAQMGSWELDLGSGHVVATEEFYHLLELERRAIEGRPFGELISELVHPADRELVADALQQAMTEGSAQYEFRTTGRGEDTLFRAAAELVRADDGTPRALRGTLQNITDQRRTEAELAQAAITRESAAREHRIADQLQASLLPARTFDPDHLQIATFYRAGVEGTQVGGDWYDVIELGAGRTALVMGDVMGRGVQAAAVMGQLRAAVRAYARLDLPPADVLENLDLAVRELSGDHIVTCIYAVYDPGERTLTYANAGHLPPLLAEPGRPVRRLVAAAAPPLGIGESGMVEERVELSPDALIALYTDGLVEHRDRDLDTGINALVAELEARTGPMDDLPMQLVTALLPDGPDDDIAVLLARVDQSAVLESSLTMSISEDVADLSAVRARVGASLRAWGVAGELVDDVVLLVSELATNAMVYGKPPAELRVRRGPTQLVLEVEDHATYLPRRMRPTDDDEHGRGLQLTSLLAARWGTRPTREGKVVWCVFPLARA